MPMLLDIRDTVADYAELIARVVGVDVEVVDAGLNRLAGTGLYASGVGENIRAEGETYRHVMRIRRSFVMEAPREHFICTRCPGRDLCRETLSISTPIIDGSDVLGVIGLVCSTDEDRARVLEHKDVYVQFIERCAEFILHKLHDHADLLRARSFLDIMLRILEINSRGIVIFNAKGGISYLNDIARRDLGLKDDGLPTDVQFKRTGESFSDLEEFVVTARSRKHTLMGQMTPLVPSDYHFATVFTFESLPRMADRVSSLGDALSGVENLIGRSPAMLQLKDQIRQIAGSTSTVLVTGESGTGKELVARAIHAASGRRDKPFIGINCGAIPDALLESELFGYTGGAFTGASAKGRIGKFELAHKGVLFLDEISTMPLYLQVKLLRVLQERCFERLGGTESLTVDVRIITATNRDLSRMVEEGTFRRDLYYRLNVFPIHMPPLRERQNDIQPLAAYFADKYAAANGRTGIRISLAVMDMLQRYAWPGNIRELENVMERAVLLVGPEGLILPQHLPRELHSTHCPFGAAAHKAAADPHAAPGSLQDRLDELERACITDALARHKGHVGHAAQALGLTERVMALRMKKHGISYKEFRQH